MSLETRTWLSENTLIGFTTKRGNAWHYREGDGNHYADAVPIEDVRKRLFDWEAEEQPLFIQAGERMAEVPGKKAIVRSDTGHVMGIFSDGYQPHQYEQWLLDHVAAFLDDDLSIGSAGLLRGGAVAWVSVEVPETLTTPEGVQYRPNLLAATSFDGSVATTYKRVVTNVVCDNTMTLALSSDRGGGEAYKVKHSRKSIGRLQDARDALEIVHHIGDEFAAEVAELTARVVTDRQWEQIVHQLAPTPGEDAGKRARTMAENKRGDLWRLWTADERVAPWAGTAFGVWQAVNTYQHHQSAVRKQSRPEKNMLYAVTGKTEQADRDAVKLALAA